MDRIMSSRRFISILYYRRCKDSNLFPNASLSFKEDKEKKSKILLSQVKPVTLAEDKREVKKLKKLKKEVREVKEGS